MLKTSNYRCYHYSSDFSFDDRTDIVASVLLASISIIQFKNEAKEYHQERLERKENAVGTY
jgi:hypothetical protein